MTRIPAPGSEQGKEMKDKNRHKVSIIRISVISLSVFVIAIIFILLHKKSIAIKVFYIPFTREWNFWTCAEAIGTIGATIVALFGLNLKESREKRRSVAKVVSSWISEESKPNADGSSYVRTAVIHINNESDEPVYDVAVNTTLDKGNHWIGPLSSPNQIPVLPAHRELQFDITIPLLGYRHLDTPQVACTFVDPNGRIWERNIDGTLRDCSKEKPHWVGLQNDELPIQDCDFNVFNPMAVCLTFLNLLNTDTNGEDIKSLLSPQADGWKDVDWENLKHDFGKCMPSSNVRFPAPQVANILLTDDESLQGKKVEGWRQQIHAKAMVTLTFSHDQGWRIFGIGDRVLPEEILFPEGTLTQGKA